jgi:hypothetical protein
MKGEERCVASPRSAQALRADAGEWNAERNKEQRTRNKELGTFGPTTGRVAKVWPRVAQRSDWIPDGATDSLVSEIDQLVAIFIASARTARTRLL